MSIFGRKCPQCGALVLGQMRFCGRCGCDIDAQEIQRADIEKLRPVRQKEPAWSDETPRPTETARVFEESRTERMSRFFQTGWFSQMSRKDIIKLACAIAAALVIIIAAIILIVRMNTRTAPPVSEESTPSDTVHTIDAGDGLAAVTPVPTPEATARPTAPPVAATLTPATPGFIVSDVSGYVYALPAALEIRSGPGMEYDVIATVAQGTALTRTGVLDGWTRVMIEGREGYVPHDQISMEPEPTPTPTPLVLDFEVDDMDDYIVIDTGANLRIGPGTEYDVVDYAGAGAELHRTGVIDGWSQVEYDGGSVYVFNELLRSDETPAPDDVEQPQETEQTTELQEPEPEIETPTENTSESTITLRLNANIRTGPGTEYDIIGLADGGSTLQASELVNGWYKVDFLGQTGYVLASLTE